MPGRYLLIEFDDDTAADTLRAQISAASKRGKKFRVVGLFARPGRPCSCIIAPGERAKGRVKRGGRFGWWVCTFCGRPRAGNHELQNIITPPEVDMPFVFEGVDTLSTSSEPQDFIRHPSSISIITYPARVAITNKG